MQKPENKQVKDFIIEKISQELQVNQDIVDSVIGWSYEKANKASHKNREIELSGIGILQLSQSKLRKQIKKLERMISLTEHPDKVAQMENTLKELKTKLDE